MPGSNRLGGRFRPRARTFGEVRPSPYFSRWKLLSPFGLAVAMATVSAVACGATGDTGSEDAGTGALLDANLASDRTVPEVDASAADGATAAEDGSPPFVDGGARDADRSDAANDGAVEAANVDASDAQIAIEDPFDPRSCDAPAMTAGQATIVLGAAPRIKLADATLLRRERRCTGPGPETCGAWGAPVPHTQALLTYSGGVVTDYKTFAFPTHLVLFSQAGQPRFSIRHASDYLHDATASTRGVGFGFGTMPMVNTYPIIYVWDFAPAPNRYDDLQGLLGNKAELHAAERCARFVATNGVAVEIAALYRY